MFGHAFIDPAWQVAVATWILTVVTAPAAFFGARAAYVASRAYRLESDPILVVRKLDREEKPPHDPAKLLQNYVVVGVPLLTDGITIRPYNDSDAEHPNAELALRRAVVLEIRNIGRSPAIAVEAKFCVSTLTFESETTLDIARRSGFGFITIDGLGANAALYIVIENLVGNAVELRAARTATCVNVERTKRRPGTLAVIAPNSISLPVD